MLRSMNVLALGVSIVCAAGASQALAQIDTNPQQVLEQAIAAFEDAAEFGYNAQFWGEGSQGGLSPMFRGRATLMRAEGDPRGWFLLEGQISPPGEPGAERQWQSLTMARDAGKTRLLDEQNATLAEAGDPELSQRMFKQGGHGVLPEFNNLNEFRKTLRAEELIVEPSQVVDDVECDVITVRLRGDMMLDRWYIAKADHLPRRVDRIRKISGEDNFWILTLSSPYLRDAGDPAQFTLAAPAGANVIDMDALAAEARKAQAEHDANTLVQVGEPAPDFDLMLTTGDVLRFRETRGSVLVLDFWATWCKPCRAAMPHLQALHKKYADKGLRVVGVNCHERNAQVSPAAFMKDMGCDYALALAGEAVAQKFKVTGLPTIYVIDRNGKVAFAGSGFSEDIQKQIDQAVEASLGLAKPAN